MTTPDSRLSPEGLAVRQARRARAIKETPTLGVQCPKCYAVPGEECVSLRGRNRDYITERPHPARVKAHKEGAK